MVAAVITLPRGAFYIMLTALSVGPREHVPRAPSVSMCATHLLLYFFTNPVLYHCFYTKPHSSPDELCG